jgi:hypothetical protein
MFRDPRFCDVCKKRYVPKTSRSKYCCPACRKTAYRIRHLDILKPNADPVHIWVELTALGKRLQAAGLHVIEPVKGQKTQYYIVRNKKRKSIRRIGQATTRPLPPIPSRLSARDQMEDLDRMAARFAERQADRDNPIRERSKDGMIYPKSPSELLHRAASHKAIGLPQGDPRSRDNKRNR